MELTAEHKKKIKKIVAKADKQTMTVKTVRRTLEKSLGLEKDALKPLKEELTAYVTLLIDPPTPAKEKKPPAKKAKPESTEDARIVQLKKMGQAVRAGPTLFKGLKDLDADAKAAELKERLVAKGYEIAGEAPTVSDSAWELSFKSTYSPWRFARGSGRSRDAPFHAGQGNQGGEAHARPAGGGRQRHGSQ